MIYYLCMASVSLYYFVGVFVHHNYGDKLVFDWYVKDCVIGIKENLSILIMIIYWGEIPTFVINK